MIVLISYRIHNKENLYDPRKSRTNIRFCTKRDSVQETAAFWSSCAARVVTKKKSPSWVSSTTAGEARGRSGLAVMVGEGGGDLGFPSPDTPSR